MVKRSKRTFALGHPPVSGRATDLARVRAWCELSHHPFKNMFADTDHLVSLIDNDDV